MKLFNVSCCAALCLVLLSCETGWEREEHAGYYTVTRKGSPVIGVSYGSGVSVLEVDGRPFKDLNKNGALDPYEDWRLSSMDRAEDLARRLSIEEIAGLMMYSKKQHPDSSALTDELKVYMGENCVRHILLGRIPDARTGAEWSNNVQAFCEATPLGIPANNSTDPRNYTEADGEFSGASGDISHWPGEIGIASTFDPSVARKHGEVVSAEYRALGITTALSPQADIAPEPRWYRFFGTYGENPYLVRDIVREYCDAFQTTLGSRDGWGVGSVNCMVKHWPGGGTGEAGRDAHFGIGKYAVYPGGRFDLGLIPFVQGAFNLRDRTRMASAVMPYYTISYNQDPSGNNVGNGFSRYIIQDLLRDKYGYEGVVCTDWGIVNDYGATYLHAGKPWGVETLSSPQKRLLVFEAGVDQLGGVQDIENTVAAYRLWAAKYGEESARERFELSARRLLVNIFRVGSFENPYVDPEEAVRLVGCSEFMAAGYDAQLKSVIMLKNKGGFLPAGDSLKVYVPDRKQGDCITFWRAFSPGSVSRPVATDLLEKYFSVVSSPEEADFAMVFIKGPDGNWGYDSSRNVYAPISLQWSDYKAECGRQTSIAGGDPTEESADRSYNGVTEHTYNMDDLYTVRETSKLMDGKPLVLVVTSNRPFVPAEVEPFATSVLLSLGGVSNQALLDIASGRKEPSGLLPCQLPKDMTTVEKQYEDVPQDMECYVDECGNSYDFAFGMNWSGVISDRRVKRYRNLR